MKTVVLDARPLTHDDSAWAPHNAVGEVEVYDHSSDEQVLIPGQGNNLYIFPAVGLAIYATRAKRVSDEMFIAAAHAVANQVTQAELDSGLLYPPQSDILKTEVATALPVIKMIFDRGLARVEKPSNLNAFLQSQLYKPEYKPVG